MMKAFKCKDTEALFNDRRVLRFQGVENPARRKLMYHNRARKLQDLRVPPGNELEALKGDRTGQHSFASTNSGEFASNGGMEMSMK